MVRDNPEGVKRRVTVWKDTRGNGFCVGVRFPVPHKTINS